MTKESTGFELITFCDICGEEVITDVVKVEDRHITVKIPEGTHILEETPGGRRLFFCCDECQEIWKEEEEDRAAMAEEISKEMEDDGWFDVPPDAA